MICSFAPLVALRHLLCSERFAYHETYLSHLLAKNILFFSYQTRCPHFLQWSLGQVLRMFLLGTEKEAVKSSLPLNRQPAGVEILTFRRREGRRPQGESGSPWKRTHDSRAAFLAQIQEGRRKRGWAWVSDFLTTTSSFCYSLYVSSYSRSCIPFCPSPPALIKTHWSSCLACDWLIS